MRMLKDRQQFDDSDGEAERMGISSAIWPLFGVVWDSGQVLAHHMHQFDIAGKRILEAGCGLATSSLLLAQRDADILASDYHPEAGKFLVENNRINGGKDVPFFLADWAKEYPDLGTFDLIIGSDLLYEAGQDTLLADFVRRHAGETSEVIIADPGRPQAKKFTKLMEGLGFEHSRHRPDDLSYLDKPFKGYIHTYKR